MKFKLEGHDSEKTNREWVVTRIEHEGYAPDTIPEGKGVYQNRFSCVRGDALERPRLPRKKPQQMLETATVAGPKGKEIHVDEHARVKVQFHWDHDGKNDDKSSCWLRVSQTWAGAGFGAQFLPRIGTEVLVGFLGGDVDRPIVVGALYNATHPTPFQLPSDANKSGFRTASTPATKGGSELSFDDTAGEELVFVAAQKDMKEVVENDRHSVVKGSRIDESHQAASRVRANQLVEIGGARTTVVQGDETREVKKNVLEALGGNVAVTVEGETSASIKQGCSVEVRGNYSFVVGTPGAPACSEHHASGTLGLDSGDRIVITAEKEIVLKCGKSSLEILEDKIVLRGPKLELSAWKKVECWIDDGPKVKLDKEVEILTDKFHLFTEEATLELDKEFKARGRTVKLQYDPKEPPKDDKKEKPETIPFTARLMDYYLVPHSKKTVHLTAEGQRFELVTDANGNIAADIPKGATQVAARLWLEKYPEGHQQHYTFDLVKLAAPNTILGAKQRLKNLGYYRGLLNTVDDGEFRQAVHEFQADHQDSHALEPNGVHDANTSGALEESHGN